MKMLLTTWMSTGMSSKKIKLFDFSPAKIISNLLDTVQYIW